MKYVNLTLIILFILIDILVITDLWNEDFYRRFLHHIQKMQHNTNKKPWIVFPDISLYQDEIDILLQISEKSKDKCLNNISKVGALTLGGNYSKKCSLYFNDFNKESQIVLDKIGNRLKPYYEEIIQKKLYLGNSDFRCCILRYEGKDSQFSYHYDTEEYNCYRSIFLIKKNGNISPFTYYDINNKLNKRHLELGKGLFFQGTKTYHGIDPSEDPNSIRYIVGWQYTTDPNIKTYSLCSELRGKNIIQSISIIAKPIIIMNILIYIWNKYLFKKNISTEKIIKLTIISSILLTFLPKYLPNYIGTNLTLRVHEIIIYILICLLSSLSSMQNGLLLYNYKVLTEMFLPSTIISKTLENKY